MNLFDRNGEPLAVGDTVKTELGDIATVEGFEETAHGLVARVVIHDEPGTPAHRSIFKHIAKKLRKIAT